MSREMEAAPIAARPGSRVLVGGRIEFSTALRQFFVSTMQPALGLDTAIAP